MGGGAGIVRLLPAALLMTSADRNDLMPAQEKLKWVTPKISLMEAGDTEGNKTGGPETGPGFPLSGVS